MLGIVPSKGADPVSVAIPTPRLVSLRPPPPRHEVFPNRAWRGRAPTRRPDLPASQGLHSAQRPPQGQGAVVDRGPERGTMSKVRDESPHVEGEHKSCSPTRELEGASDRTEAGGRLRLLPKVRWNASVVECDDSPTTLVVPQGKSGCATSRATCDAVQGHCTRRGKRTAHLSIRTRDMGNPSVGDVNHQPGYSVAGTKRPYDPDVDSDERGEEAYGPSSETPRLRLIWHRGIRRGETESPTPFEPPPWDPGRGAA